MITLSILSEFVRGVLYTIGVAAFIILAIASIAAIADLWDRRKDKP